MQLDSHPDLQLDYIEKILREDREDNQKEIPDCILIKHIELLCEKRKKSVKKELEAWNYPQDEALSLCKEKQVLDA